MREREPYPWKILFVLVAAGIFGVLCLLPYAISLMRAQMPTLSASTWTLVLLQLAQSAVLLTVTAAVGLPLARKTGFRMPLLASWLLRRRRALRPWTLLWKGIFVGAAVGAAIVILGQFVFAPFLPKLPSEREVAIWKRFLACFYGGIDEEIFLRLFLMSLGVWLLGMLLRRPIDRPSPLTVWISNAATAIVFGLTHLPAASLASGLTPMLVLYVVLLNAIAGISFGYVYWRQGLEAAMVCHFTADLVLHVLGPFLKR